MKKLFEKPVMDVLFFDEGDVITVSGNGDGDGIIQSLDLYSNTEIAADGLDASVVTVEKASSLISK